MVRCWTPGFASADTTKLIVFFCVCDTQTVKNNNNNNNKQQKCINVFFFFFQDENSRLEPGEFKQCLVSLGYNLKEGDKVWQWLLLFLICGKEQVIVGTAICKCVTRV